MNATAASIELSLTPPVQYVLRIADTCLIHAQRLAEWCGHAPVLEEDIALANMALDLLGQARSLLAHAGALEGADRETPFSADELAFLRDERDFFNLTLVELPIRRGRAQGERFDFADTVLRNFLLASWLLRLWQALVDSADRQLAAIAGKAVKEARYHRQHAADWVVRLGDGTVESAARLQAALGRAWPYTAEMFADDAVDAAAGLSRLGPPRAALRAGWEVDVAAVLAEARLAAPSATPFMSTGTSGRHSEHMGYILAEMQSLQRQYPGGRW